MAADRPALFQSWFTKTDVTTKLCDTHKSAFSSASRYDGDDMQLCLDLLDQEKLALVPRSSFGAPGHVRISYATSLEELRVAMEKLHRFLSSLG